MSRKGKAPITVSKNVKVNLNNRLLQLEGPKGKLDLEIPDGIQVEQNEDKLQVTRKDDTKQNRANHGTYRSLIQNMIVGVENGHKRDLEIQGIGFRCELKGTKVVFNLGLSHPVEFEIPKDVKVTVPNQTSISVEGIDNIRVGQVAATLRAIKPAEPYKGKGIRYVGEEIRRKQGKSVAK